MRPVRLSPLSLAALLLVSVVTSAVADPELRLVVLKAERRLELHQDGTVVKTYRIGLGNTPTGPKLRQGDGRTPEGTFYVCVKNPRSKFHRSLGLSYPTPADADRGLAEQLITPAAHAAILSAHRTRSTPPWDTALGGEIFIHGHGSGSDWTLGCIALDDAEMTDLYARVAKGTPVEIRP